MKFVKFTIYNKTPKCQFCGSSDTIDNGDSYYCYSCGCRNEYE